MEWFGVVKGITHNLSYTIDEVRCLSIKETVCFCNVPCGLMVLDVRDMFNCWFFQNQPSICLHFAVLNFNLNLSFFLSRCKDSE